MLDGIKKLQEVFCVSNYLKEDTEYTLRNFIENRDQYYTEDIEYENMIILMIIIKLLMKQCMNYGMF